MFNVPQSAFLSEIPFNIAAVYGHLEVLKLLKEQGACDYPLEVVSTCSLMICYDHF